MGGTIIAYFTGWTLALIYTAACAFEAISIGQLVGLLFPDLRGPELYRLLGHNLRAGDLAIGAAAATLVGLLNAMGAKGTAAAQQWVTLLRIALMVGFLGIALAYSNPANLRPLISGATTNAQFLAFLAVLGSAPFWYAGFNVVATASEESATSLRMVGRALIFSIVASGVFYVALVMAVSALVPPAQLGRMELPAANAFEAAMGTSVVAKVVLATGILGNLTAWNALLLGGSRVFFALGRAGLSPSVFGRVSPRNGAPVAAVLLITVVTLLCLPLGRGFVLPLVNITSACFGITYVITCLTVLKLRRLDLTTPAYLVPGGRAVIALATLASLAITAAALIQPWYASRGVPPEWLTMAGWFAISGLIWILLRNDIRTLPENQRAMLISGRA